MPDTTGHVPPRVRVFLASPGDVSHERSLAFAVLENLQNDPLVRRIATIETVAWDRPGPKLGMLATMTPQEAISRGLPRPSECDIVVVILWSRMGTRLPDEWRKADGSPYLSGTEWEYLDAIQAAESSGRPDVLVYRCTRKVLQDLDDSKLEENSRQYRMVKSFFDAFRASDGGPIRRSSNEYEEPEEFKRALDHHLRGLLKRFMSAQASAAAGRTAPAVPAAAVWKGCPFPGLRSLSEDDAPIFFGRDAEVSDLITALSAPDRRFLAVVGASGSGKSSLVAAGLLPHLARGAIAGSEHWRCLRFSPAEIGDDPFIPLASKLSEKLKGMDIRPRQVLERLREGATGLKTLAGAAAVDVLLFIDQFEELFTLVRPDCRARFVEVVSAATRLNRYRVLITMRADFFSHCAESPELAGLMRAGTYPLPAPGLGALREMITGPAARAGLRFEKGLEDGMLEDTGTEPGRLALMAFALSELYEARSSDGELTLAAYQSFNGVRGAIAQRAEQTFAALDVPEAEAAVTLASVFSCLVEVDGQGAVTRQRVPVANVTITPAAERLVERFTEARLLVRGLGEDGRPTVEVAHESLLSNWPRLAGWVAASRDDLRLLRQLQDAAVEWDRRGRRNAFLWNEERRAETFEMIGRLQPTLNEVEALFIKGYDRIFEELLDAAMDHSRRAALGDEVDIVGDSRAGIGLSGAALPEFVWLAVPRGRVTVESEGARTVGPLEISKYPTTWRQYRAFVDAANGFRDLRWWDGFGGRAEQPGPQARRRMNHPAEHVSWYDAAGFCRWLSAELGQEIRLPTEWEWQHAATGGDAGRSFPWGSGWNLERANTQESRLSRTTAVGLYPDGRSPNGAFDFSGNVWEWCSNGYSSSRSGRDRWDPRVVRGGSFRHPEPFARTTSRLHFNPDAREPDIGFRVVRVPPRASALS